METSPTNTNKKDETIELSVLGAKLNSPLINQVAYSRKTSSDNADVSDLHKKRLHAFSRKNSQSNVDQGINYFYALNILVKSSIPSVLSLLFLFLYDNINVIFAGKYLSSTDVSCIGLGTLYINATGFFLGLGLLGGVDTLCSQAFGARQFYLMGLYANISRIVLLAFYIFVCLPFILLSEYALEIMGQPEELILHTSLYVKSLLPSVFFSLQFYAHVHYLQAMNIFTPGMIVSFITALFHPLWVYIFLGIFNMDLIGIAYAMGITHMLNYVIMTIYIHYFNPHKETYFSFDYNSVNLKRILDFLKMAVTSAIMFSGDWLGFHILILYSSYFDLTTLTANVCIFNFIVLLFSIPLGISFAASTLVGNCIGSNQVKSAKTISFLACALSMLVVLVITLFFQLFKDSLPYIYTNDEEVAKIFRSLLNFFIYFGVTDALQLVLNGVLKGLGKQKPASFLVIIIFYPINIPMSVTFAFTINYGLIGLWYSQFAAAIFLNFSYLLMIFCLDWENNAHRTVVKINFIGEKMKRKNSLLLKAKER